MDWERLTRHGSWYGEAGYYLLVVAGRATGTTMIVPLRRSTMPQQRFVFFDEPMTMETLGSAERRGAT